MEKTDFCPECGCQVVYAEGCCSCLYCGWSACGYGAGAVKEYQNSEA